MHRHLWTLLLALAAFSALALPAAAADPKPASKSAERPKWNVTHQLVQGMPWHSVKLPEKEVLAGVAESESTPDQRLVLALNDLGGWYRGKGRYDEAEKIYRRVLDLQMRRGLAMHHDLALSHNDIGVVSTDAGKLDAAETFFKTAVDIWQKRWDGPLPTEDYAVTLHNYAVLLEKRGRADEARVMEGKADEIMAARKKAMGF